jgi:hypothetical protein
VEPRRPQRPARDELIHVEHALVDQREPERQEEVGAGDPRRRLPERPLLLLARGGSLWSSSTPSRTALSARNVCVRALDRRVALEHGAALRDVGIGEEQVVRAGGGAHRQLARLRGADRVARGGGRDVEEVDARTGRLAELDRLLDGDALRVARAGAPELGGLVAEAGEALAHHRPVLGVQHEQAVRLGHFGEDGAQREARSEVAVAMKSLTAGATRASSRSSFRLLASAQP